MNKSNQKLLFSFIAGAAAGAFIGKYVESDKGKKEIKNLKKKAAKWEKSVEAKSHEQLQELSNRLQELKDEVNQRLANVAVAGLSQTEELAGVVQEKAGKTKSKIAETKSKIAESNNKAIKA